MIRLKTADKQLITKEHIKVPCAECASGIALDHLQHHVENIWDY